MNKKATGLTIGLIGLGITSAASIALNIFQGMQNKKCRNQIEMLEKIIQNHQNDIDELKKQMKALKIWAFKQRLEYLRQIKSIEQDMNRYKLQLSNLQSV